MKTVSEISDWGDIVGERMSELRYESKRLYIMQYKEIKNMKEMEAYG